MKKLPKILIIGRPNVGKSTFINRIVKKQKAITLDTPGVTRDLAYFPTTWKGKNLILIDSGGIILEEEKSFFLQEKIEELVLKATNDAEKIIFLTDYQTGINPIDKKIAQVLRPLSEKVIVAINKSDNLQSTFDIGDYYKLGFDAIYSISSIHGIGINNLLDTITADFSSNINLKEIVQDSFKIAIVGRPNVGKSSLVNAIVNEERVIVDHRAHTTRDSIEVFFENQGKKYFFIDTAGIRKKARIEKGIEFFSVVRSTKAIKNSDLTVFVTDMEGFLCDQDKKILTIAIREKANIVIFINKWDLTERTDQIRKDLELVAAQAVPGLVNYPFICGSAKEKINIGKLFKMIPEVIATSQIRISTGKLNKFIEDVIRKNPPPAKGGKHIKIYYATQPESFPPVFIFFVNHPKQIDENYQRFLEKRIRNYLNEFKGVSIQIYFKKHRV
ncbi:ribosome biogenesis GTPase Der [Candidatus Margulisiibacteriota bacterium]